MNDKEIKQVAYTRLEKIREYCNKIEKKFAVEDIHGFRTEVKKLRAFLRIISFVFNESKKYKLPKKLRKLYSRAGAIRDIQLQLERIESATQNEAVRPKVYSSLLKKEMNQNKKRLKKQLAGNFMKRSEKKIYNKLPQSVGFETIRRFVFFKISDMEALITKRKENDNDIHSVRKNLKDLMYNVKTVDDNLKQAFPKIFSDADGLKTVEQLSDQLGMFTDMSAALSYTEPSYLNKVNVEERQQLQRVRSQWLQKKNQLRQSAIKDLAVIKMPAITD